MEFLTGTVSAVFWGLIVLSLLVVVHESGHFLMARIFGVRVTEFFLGMPSRHKISRKSEKHGTEFGVTPLLLGGYNRICGMESTQDELLPEVLSFVYSMGSVHASDICDRFSVDEDRAFAILMTLVDWASIRMDDSNDSDDPAFNTIPRDEAYLCEYDEGHDRTALSAHADGDAYDVSLAPGEFLEHERSHVYQGMGVGKRLAMLIMGPFVNIVFALLVVTFSLSVIGIDAGSTEPVIGTVYEDSIAAAAGIEPGDTITRIGDHKIATWYDISDALDELLVAGASFDIAVDRAGSAQTIHIDIPSGEDPELLGITNTIVKVRLPLGDAIASAFAYAGQVAQFALRLINPAHTMEVVGQSSSIVGMSVMASEAAAAGVFDLLLVVAAISMSLGFMNLLPVPPLDGGKILFELIQLAIGRPVSIKVQNIVSYVGLGLLFVLFVFVLRNDIINYIM